jgi:hypothetical protein
MPQCLRLLHQLAYSRYIGQVNFNRSRRPFNLRFRGYSTTEAGSGSSENKLGDKNRTGSDIGGQCPSRAQLREVADLLSMHDDSARW